MEVASAALEAVNVSFSQGPLAKEVAFPQLQLVSTALPGAGSLLLIRYSIRAHGSEETCTICANHRCQGSLEKKKEELSRVGSLNLAKFPYFRNDSKYMIALCQYDMGRFVRVGWKNP